MNEELQKLGTNSAAQEILSQCINAAFPALEKTNKVSTQIIDKFYDWSFPFLYGTDGGGARRWKTKVTALCSRWQKLNILEEIYAKIGDKNDGTFTEAWSGTDTETLTRGKHKNERSFTDKLARRTSTGSKTIGTPTSAALGEVIEDEPIDGRNTQTETTETSYEGDDVKKMEKGTKRTYTDGRTVARIMDDVEKATSPIYDFINSFSSILIAPCEECCGNFINAPSVDMRIGKVTEADAPTAHIKNEGTPYTAEYVLDLGLVRGKQGVAGPQGPRGETGQQGPQGLQGPKGERGDQGLPGDVGAVPLIEMTADVDDKVGTPAVDVEKGGTDREPTFALHFYGLKGKTGERGEQGARGEAGPAPEITVNADVSNTTGTPDVRVKKSGTSTEPVFTLAFSGLKGEQGATGPQGEQGEPGAKGDKGEKGEQGPQGLQGPKGDRGVQGLRGPQGEQGEPGEKGDPGVTPDITINASVSDTTGTPAVTVEKSGTIAEPIFSLSFSGLKGEQGATGPQGEQGEPGAKGEQGPQGEQGEPGEKGETGPAPTIGATASVDATTGTPNVEVDNTTIAPGVYAFDFKFTGLKGEPGAKGDKGEKGEQGPQGLQGPKGDRGVQGLRGPQGEQGEQGVAGAAGVQGPPGPQGATGATPDITVNASVSNTTGTPAVTVTKSGTTAKPVFGLAFSGLKGERGATGPRGPAGVANIDEVFEKLYPVGSIYLTTSNLNINTNFPGTWLELNRDYALVSAGNGYFDGGEYTSGKLPKIKGQIGDTDSGILFGNREGKTPSHTTPFGFGTRIGRGGLGNGNGYSYSAILVFDAQSANSKYSSNGEIVPDGIRVHVWRREA